MDALKAVLPLLISLSLAGLVLRVGLDADLADILELWRRPAKLLKAVLAVNVVVPLAALALVILVPLSPPARIGILLMAISPVPPLVPGKQLKVGGEKSYAYSLYSPWRFSRSSSSRRR
jgi:BASS family bile acid:Na+ symporter